MKDQAIVSGVRLNAPRRGTLIQRFARGIVFAALRDLTRGSLTVREGGEVHRFGRARGAVGPHAEVHIHDPAAYPKVAFGGTIGAGEAYMAGHFSSPGLTSLVRLFVVNREVMNRMEGGLAVAERALHLVAHRLRRHDRSGSRRNIEAHYDLGNDFFRTFLDRDAMMYSGAIYPSPTATLEEASRHKLDRICRKLDVGPDDHVLEIGTGWGGFAMHAAKYYGCRVTTTTISPAQYAHARDWVAREGLSERVQVLQQDYRDLQGQYDKLVSIEMIEAIGHRQVGTFFRTCSRLLKSDGAMAIQAITIADRFHAQAKRSVDFIQRYIFPGGALPCISSLAVEAAAHSDLLITDVEEIGHHYAATLRDWRERFLANREHLRAAGYSERFLRMWEFYLAYCEGGFRERATGTVQLVLHKSERRLDALADGGAR